MPPPAFRLLFRHPVAVALRVVLWPTTIMVSSDLVSRSENDALAGGLMTFAVVVSLSCLLALADGLVLRTRALVLVWSITTVVLVGWMVTQPLVDALGHGPEATTWDDAVRVTLEDLTSSSLFFLVLVGVPVALGAVVGSVVRRSSTPRGGQVDRVGLGASRT